jgi:UPF0716 protein FxsA
MRITILLFILIPAIEISVLLLSGKIMGIWPTFLLIVFTGILGSYLAKKQGLNTIRKVQEQLRFGNIPSEEIIDGVCILAGGLMLLSPGFLTDIMGLIFLIPATRMLIKPFLIKMIQQWINKNTVTIIR